MASAPCIGDFKLHPNMDFELTKAFTSSRTKAPSPALCYARLKPSLTHNGLARSFPNTIGKGAHRTRGRLVHPLPDRMLARRCPGHPLPLFGKSLANSLPRSSTPSCWTLQTASRPACPRSKRTSCDPSPPHRFVSEEFLGRPCGPFVRAPRCSK